MPPTRNGAPEGQGQANGTPGGGRGGRGRGRGGRGRGRGGPRPPREDAPPNGAPPHQGPPHRAPPHRAPPHHEGARHTGHTGPTTVPFTAHVTDTRFADAPISAATKAAIRHEFMSPHSLEGHDLVVQAKTGTGKTLAFLIPIVEKLRQQESALPGDTFAALIVTPTRDLAIQIQNECIPLLKGSPFRVATAIGGTNMSTEANRILRDRCDILVATPGRLNDHLQNNRAGPKFRALQFVVYDEADRMLDAGFKPQLDSIRSYLPDPAVQRRQTLFYSATMDNSVKQVGACGDVGEGRIPQNVVEVRFEDSLPVALSILFEEIKNMQGLAKVMMFFPTANQTAWAAAALQEVAGLPQVWPMHSRLSQSTRTRTADAFKNTKTGIMVSSDVTARGMDFPNVSLVLQIGVPGTPQDYIHRLGRTARAGTSGRGVIILDPAERFFLSNREIAELPIAPLPPPAEPQLQQMRDVLRPAIAKVPKGIKGKAYRAWMGFYKQYVGKMKWTPQGLVDRAAVFVYEGLGWPSPQLPTLRKQTVGKMGLKGVRGLNIGEVEDE
ncbi:P-loop containing nucleoside triphosphate hydrolase protein [Schizophyllum commune]